MSGKIILTKTIRNLFKSLIKSPNLKAIIHEGQLVFQAFDDAFCYIISIYLSKDDFIYFDLDKGAGVFLDYQNRVEMLATITKSSSNITMGVEIKNEQMIFNFPGVSYSFNITPSARYHKIRKRIFHSHFSLGTTTWGKIINPVLNTYSDIVLKITRKNIKIYTIGAGSKAILRKTIRLGFGSLVTSYDIKEPLTEVFVCIDRKFIESNLKHTSYINEIKFDIMHLYPIRVSQTFGLKSCIMFAYAPKAMIKKDLDYITEPK